MIEISVLPPGYVHAHSSDIYGGKRLELHMDYMLQEDLRWLREHRIRLQKEEEIRSKSSAVASAYEQYQTMLKIVNDDY